MAPATGPVARQRVGGAAGRPGPAASGNTPSNGEQESAPVVIATKRTFFPETWLFKTWDFSTGQTQDNLTVKVPDTITSWVASAYALSEESGFGVADSKELTVFQPFFVSLKLPYSIVRGETLHLLASVFNYVPGCMQVTVRIKSSECHSLTAGSDSSQELCLCSDEAKSAAFNMTFLELGDCPIVVEASTGGNTPCEREGEGKANAIAFDRVTRKLKVEAEGVKREQVQSALLIKRSQQKPYSQVFHIRVPHSIVRDSGRAWITVVGDVMGPSLDGLDSLLRMPYGCGEQNMVNFAPGISIARYLQVTHQLERMSSAKDKDMDVIQSGYQRQNRYRHSNGAYSSFGPGGWKNKGGCLWLTSFVVKSFCKAKATGLVAIDDIKVCQSVSHIVRSVSHVPGNSSSDGFQCYFPNDNCVHSKALQGGGKSDLAHTAYICSALLETRRDGCQCHSPRVNSTIDCCVRYLENKIDDIDTTYAAAILCYTLTLAKSPLAEEACGKLHNMQIKKDGQCYWQQVEQKPRKNCNWWWCYTYRPPAADIEITAYALQAYVLRGHNINDLICISKWLAEQRNSFGGYRSTQDTVVGLEALSQVAKLLYVPSEKGRALKLRYHYLPDATSCVQSGGFHVDAANSMVVMKRELRSTPGLLALRVRGSGSALIQVSTCYNVRDPPPEPAFALSVTVQREKDSDEVFRLKICISWQLDDPNSSNMALVTVELPSGYVADEEDLDKLKQNGELKLERFDVDGRKVFLYFDEINHEQLCFMFTIKQDVVVENLQPTTVMVQDYYTPELEATIEYSLSKHHGECPANQTFDKCASACPHTCKGFLFGKLPICREPCQAGCRCMDNYVKYRDSCVLSSDCMNLVNICGKNEEFKGCKSTCPLTCNNYSLRIPRLCPMVCRKGCDCKRGYVRDSTGECVLSVECPGAR